MCFPYYSLYDYGWLFDWSDSSQNTLSDFFYYIFIFVFEQIATAQHRVVVHLFDSKEGWKKAKFNDSARLSGIVIGQCCVCLPVPIKKYSLLSWSMTVRFHPGSYLFYIFFNLLYLSFWGQTLIKEIVTALLLLTDTVYP